MDIDTRNSAENSSHSLRIASSPLSARALLTSFQLKMIALPSQPRRVCETSTEPALVVKSSRGSILLIAGEKSIREFVSITLWHAGYDVTLASTGKEALGRIAQAIPDLVILDVMMPETDGYAFLAYVRSDPATRTIPVMLLMGREPATNEVTRLDRVEVDDYLVKPLDPSILLTRVRTKLERPPVPKEEMQRDRQTGVFTEARFLEEFQRELLRISLGSPPGCLACLNLNELPHIRTRLGIRAEAETVKQVAALLFKFVQPLDIIGRGREAHFMLLLPQTDVKAAQHLLKRISAHIARHTFIVAGKPLRYTPTIGFVPFSAGTTLDQLRKAALAALYQAASQLDLQPVCYTRSMDTTWKNVPTRVELQAVRQTHLSQFMRPLSRLVLVFASAFGIPFALYTTLAAVGIDITPTIYLIVVLALLIMTYLIWLEGFLALQPSVPPSEPATAYPPASAIIAAYLPNEASTIVETVEAFLRMNYPAPFQVILAYNTPCDLPVERLLQGIAHRNPQFLPLRIVHSTSKAQNINAALAHVQGEFVGIFDADHHPDPGSYKRAWCWLSNGYDVVQGHCVIRNGNASWIARMVAVEFEAIYAVSHPGRARLHGFGLFGGSNGYWKMNLLRQTRMHRSMLTEDIDSSVRVIEAGGKIISDPFLISRELAPVTLKALWNQRMRWAQGWFQVSLKHLWSSLRSPDLTRRQKLGILHLLAWREIYPWLSQQMVPIMAFWAWKYGELHQLNWLVPIFVLTTLFTLSTGPGQTLFAYLLAIPEIRNHKGWFLFYLFISCVFYTGLKNLISIIAQIKECMQERDWKVTPRTLTKDT